MKTLLLLLVSITSFAQMNDKTKHVYAGTAITIGVSEVLQQCDVKPWKAVLVGFGAGVLAGAVKERVYDKEMKRGTYDIHDFGATCWGSLIGVVIEIPIIDIRNKLRDK